MQPAVFSIEIQRREGLLCRGNFLYREEHSGRMKHSYREEPFCRYAKKDTLHDLKVPQAQTYQQILVNQEAWVETFFVIHY